jgi:hypothetical protein
MHDRTNDPAAVTHGSPTGSDGPGADWLRAPAADALRYWEVRRLAYNAVLVLVVSAVAVSHWTQFLRHASIDFFLGLFLLAVLANVAYCAAYPADVFVQRSGLMQVRRRVRTALFTLGTLFAAVLAQFIARGMVAGG